MFSVDSVGAGCIETAERQGTCTGVAVWKARHRLVETRARERAAQSGAGKEETADGAEAETTALRRAVAGPRVAAVPLIRVVAVAVAVNIMEAVPVFFLHHSAVPKKKRRPKNKPLRTTHARAGEGRHCEAQGPRRRSSITLLQAPLLLRALHHETFNVNSFNIGERLYKEGKLPCNARGLFAIASPEEAANERPILVRGYDKFFNLNEVPNTVPDHIKENTLGPYEITVKENGCIIYVTGFKGSVIVTSKHAMYAPLASSASAKFTVNEEDDNDKVTHAQKGEEWLNVHLKSAGRTREELAQFLEEHNATAVFELADDEFEEHILEYPEGRRGLYLHGVNKNEAVLNTWMTERVREVAARFGFLCVESEIMADFDEMMMLSERCRVLGSYKDRPVEGFVVRCKNKETGLTFMFKIKYDEPYLMFREWREITFRLLKSQAYTTRYRLSERYGYWCARKIETHPELFEDFLKQKGIIRARNLFLREENVEESWSSLLAAAADVTSSPPTADKADPRELIPSGTIAVETVTYPAVLPPVQNVALKGSDKIMIVPMAIVGQGKSTLGSALKSQYHGKLHAVQSDNHKQKNAFLKTFMEAFKTYEVVFVDRNNHLMMHREELARLFKNEYPGGRILGVAWELKGSNSMALRNEVVALSKKRIERRGEDHKKLTPQKTPQYVKIVNDFYRDFAPVSNLAQSVDANAFDAVVPVALNSSLTERVRAVALALGWEVDEGKLAERQSKFFDS
ncbi:RNA ligase-domain-containing protein [Chytriomyces sp. MP71]|nr:RNA ligase-domain-containing protein [Chytriomyces sp. MP71]